MVYAGSVAEESATNYYLNANNSVYWTMSPIDYGDNTIIVVTCVPTVGITSLPADGRFFSSDKCSGCGLGVRPVINLSDDVGVVSGDGTINNPYVVK